MTLLSPLALLVGLAAAVPLILHLYQQRRRMVIEFSTNRFFTAGIVRAQRRLRLRRLLLLLVRMAACLLLALALARPMLTHGGFGGRPGTRDIVILLDDSLSMQTAPTEPADPSRAREEAVESKPRPTGSGLLAGGQITRFQNARRLAVEVLGELSGGDRAAVITFTGRELGDVTHSGLELSADLLRLSGEVEHLETTCAAGDAAAALARAARLLEHAAPRDRLVLVLSDLQAGDWRQSSWPQPPQPTALTIVPVTAPGETRGVWQNVVADQMTLDQAAAVVGQPNLLQVRLVNYEPATTPAEIVLEVDGQEQLRRPVQLAAQDRHVERIPLSFAAPGVHRLALSIRCRDALAADNSRYAAVQVDPQLPVLVIDGEPQAPRPRGTAFFLGAALRAAGGGQTAESTPSAEPATTIQLDTIRPEDLAASSLDGYRVALLSDVRQLSVAQVEWLERFVRAGGGLGILLGDSVDPAFYNDILGAESRPLGGLLPADLQNLVEAEQTSAPLHLVVAEMNHPALRRFQGTLRGALAGICVYRTWALRPREAWVLAVLERPSWSPAVLPLLVERSYGRGRVIVSAVAWQPRWTNLPLRRAFVPLSTHLVSYLAGDGAAPVEHTVGCDVELVNGAGATEPNLGRTTEPLYVARPDGKSLRAAVRVVGADPVAYLPAEDVQQPGFYTLQGTNGEGAAGECALAVNLPREESSAEVLDLDTARRLAGNWQLSTIELPEEVGGREDLGPTAPGARHVGATSLLRRGWLSRGVWDSFLWLVFVLILLEPWIADQIIQLREFRARMRRRRAA